MSTKEKSCHLQSRTDRTGRTVIEVSILNSDEVATLNIEDWLKIVNDHGLSPFYKHHNPIKAGHVLFKSKRDRRVVVVARIIMGDPKNEMVVYADGDLTNLRRSNLYERKGGPGGTRRTARKAPAESVDGNSEAAA